MLKKIIFASALSLLAGCSSFSSFSSDDDLTQSVEQVIPYENHTEITGVKLSPEFSGKLTSAEVQLIANIGAENTTPKSKFRLDLEFFDNNSLLYFVNINDKKQKMKEYSVSTRICGVNCNITQHLSFPVSNAVLEKGAIEGLTLNLTSKLEGHPVVIEVPAGYISSILNTNSVISKREEATPEASTESMDTVATTQSLYLKATDAEKSKFSDWAFKNRDAIKTKLNGEGKVLPMLEYWFGKANSDEKAKILTWMLYQ